MGKGAAVELVDMGQIDSLADALNSVESSGRTIEDLKIENLYPGKHQPRHDMDPDTLDELADSIKSQGVLQPLLVRPVEDGHEIIFGHRRYEAAKIAGLESVPCCIREVTDQMVLALSLIENIDRENMSLYDTALGVANLVSEFNAKKAAEILGKKPQWISKHMAIAKSPGYVHDFLRVGYSNDVEGFYQLSQLAKRDEGLAKDIINRWETDPSSRVSLRAQVLKAKNAGSIEPEKEDDDTPEQSPPMAESPAIENSSTEPDNKKAKRKTEKKESKESMDVDGGSDISSQLPPIVVKKASMQDDLLVLDTNEGVLRLEISPTAKESIKNALV